MSSVSQRDVDVLVFGGGCAGLWLLDELHHRGFTAMLAERDALGAGQTVASQGIIHGGLKYTLSGVMSESARAIRDMPGLWRSCLRGDRQPDLSEVRVLSESCFLWRTSSLKSKIGMVGARAGLRSVVEKVPRDSLPPVLAGTPGEVFRIDEQVIDPASLVRVFASRHRPRMLLSDGDAGVEFVTDSPRHVSCVRFVDVPRDAVFEVRPNHIVFTAGEGNERLGELVGMTASPMQRRPLQMVVVRGDLPQLFGHCVDGGKTRATITTATDFEGRRVWQVGGQISEIGVGMDDTDLIRHAKNELTALLPGVDLGDVEWGTYRVNRAEGRTGGGARPNGPVVCMEGNVIVAWPTKLVLAPELVKLVVDRIGLPSQPSAGDGVVPSDWQRPEVALPPWETNNRWISVA